MNDRCFMQPAPIYLDNNSTTAMDPVVAELMYQYQRELIANPASQHRLGRLALRRLEEAKDTILAAIGAPTSGMESAQLILTSGGTEANNMAVRGYALSSGIVIVAATEHASVLDVARELGPDRCRILPVDGMGQVNINLLQEWLDADAPHIRLVSVMLGNNETGIVQDLPVICQICQRHAVPVHCDAVQAIGKIPVDMKNLGVSALSLTAHKLHGPVGVGALVLLPGQQVAPLLLGGGQQLGLRPGTEPVVPAAAMALAVEVAHQSLKLGSGEFIGGLRDTLERRLSELSDIAIIGHSGLRLPHVSTVAFHGIDRQAMQMALDFAGVACSTGSACASGSSRPSPVLMAMRLEEKTVASAIRFSLSRFTTAEDIELAADRIVATVQKLRSK